jgi:outer membrane protein assembly factor BamB
MRRVRTSLPVCLVLGSWVVCCSGVNADSWSRFRGPNGTGIAADRDVPVKWNGADGVLWKKSIPGTGNSSPVIWGERLFLQSASSDGHERTLWCLAATDGKVIWSRAVPGAKARTHAKNTLASSTPAVDGERVYALFWDGHDVSLTGFSMAGDLLWQRDLGSFTSQHGPGASPMVYKDKVILMNDQDGAAVLIALDARTGKPAWQAPRKAYRACYSTPFLLENPGDAVELIVASTGGITSYNPMTGKENWNYAWEFAGMPLRTVASPIYHAGMIFANSGDGGGARHTLALKIDDREGPKKVSLAWEEKKTFPYVPTMLAYGDFLFYVNDSGHAGCCVAATGKTVWLESLGGNMTASPVLIDGKIYAINENGTVYVYAAADHYKLLAKNSIGESVLATPAVAENRLYIRGKDHLFCIGKPANKTATGGP